MGWGVRSAGSQGIHPPPITRAVMAPAFPQMDSQMTSPALTAVEKLRRLVPVLEAGDAEARWLAAEFFDGVPLDPGHHWR